MKQNYKIGFVGDVHDDINPMIQEQVVPALKTVIDQAIERKLDALVFLGDLTVKRGYLPPDVATRIRTQIERAARTGIKVKLFPGNHDYSIRGGADNVSAIFSIEQNGGFVSVMDNIEVITAPKVIDLDAVELAIVPYPNKYNLMINLEDCKDPAAEVSKRLPLVLQGLAAQLSDKKPAILCTHLNIQGSETDSEQVMPTGLDIEINAGDIPAAFALCMNGHLHKRQKIEQGPGDPLIIMPGCIAPLQYSTRPQKHAWDMFEIKPEASANGRFTRHEIAIPVQHPLVTAKLDNDTLISWDTEEALGNAIYNGMVNTYDKSSHLKLSLKCFKATLDLINRPVLEAELKKYFYSAAVTYERTDSDDARSSAITLESSLEGQLSEWAKINGIPEGQIPALLTLSTEIEAKLPADQVAAFRARNYKPVRLWWQNYKPLGTGEIVFDQLGRLTCIYGPNTLGKSNISELEAFAIWKAILRGGTLADIPRLAGDGRAVVGLEFKAAGDHYKIERGIILTKSAAKSEMLFSKLDGNGEWTVNNSGDQADTQAEIERLCGSLDLYLATRYASQFDIDRLMKMKPAELKDTLQRALNTGVYDVRNATAKELQNADKRDMELKSRDVATQEQLAADHAGALVDLQTAMNMKNKQEKELAELTSRETEIAEEGNKIKRQYDTLAEQGKRRTEAGEKLQTANLDLTNALIAKKQLLDQMTAKTRSIADIPGRRAGLNSSIEKDRIGYAGITGDQEMLDKQSTEITEAIIELQNMRREKTDQDGKLETEVKEHTDAIQSLQLTQTGLKHQLTRATADAALLHQVGCKDNLFPCPLLENARDAAGKLDELTAEISKLDEQITEKLQLVAALTKQRQGLKTKIAEMDHKNMKLAGERNLVDDYTRDLKDKARAYLADIDRATKELEALAVLESSLTEITSKIAASEATLAILEKNKAERQKEFEACPDVDLSGITASLETTRLEWQHVNTLKKAAQEQVNDIATAIGHCQARIEAAEIAEGKAKAIQAEMLALQEKIAMMEIYLSATSRDGIPYLLLERSLPRMRDIVNGYLENTREADRFLRIDITAVTESQKGRARNEVNISFTDEKGTHPVTEVSGYQRMAIGGALRAALAKVQAEATGAEINLFWQDEGFAASDKDNLMGCQQMLLKIAQDFGKVVYISHQDEMKEVADTLIRVEGDPVNGTRIELIN